MLAVRESFKEDVLFSSAADEACSTLNQSIQT